MFIKKEDQKKDPVTKVESGQVKLGHSDLIRL